MSSAAIGHVSCPHACALSGDAKTGSGAMAALLRGIVPPTKLDDRQNHLRDVARPGGLAKVGCCAIITGGRHSWAATLKPAPSWE